MKQTKECDNNKAKLKTTIWKSTKVLCVDPIIATNVIMDNSDDNWLISIQLYILKVKH